MMKVPEGERITKGPLASDPSSGNNGAFFILPTIGRRLLICIASDGGGWDHVSVHVEEGKKFRTPTWDEMCQVKDLFWDETDTVVQFHPPKADYINDHPHTLHLWKRQGARPTLPPKEFV